MLVATSGAADAAQNSDLVPTPTEASALPLLAEAARAATDSERLSLVDRALAQLLQPTQFRGAVLCYKGGILQQLSRRQDARAAFDQCLQLRPNDPKALIAIAFDKAQEQRPAEAAVMVMRAVAIEPHAADDIDPDSMATLDRQLRYSRLDNVANDLLGKLALAGYARRNPSAFSDAAFAAVLSATQQGDVKAAVQLLPSILSPEPGIKMLIDRQFAAIWPSVEEWAGADLLAQRTAFLNGARATYEAASTPANTIAYADALVQTGHLKEGVDLLDKSLSDSNTWVTDGWYRNMAVIKLGRLLGESGQRERGIRLMQQAMSQPRKEDDGANNIVPNLVVQQLLARDYQGALTTLNEHTPATGTLETPAAAGFFVALRACADEGLGHERPALAGAKRVRDEYSSVYGAVSLAVACTSSPDEQASLWIERVSDPVKRSAALLEIAQARYRQRLRLPIKALDDKMLRQISDRRDVRKAYDRYGREIPSSLLPALVYFNLS
jgi:tetratricopeptide (TPR) repeat protein